MRGGALYAQRGGALASAAARPFSPHTSPCTIAQGFTSTAGAVSCSAACAAGTYFLAAAASCVSCGAGFFCPGGAEQVSCAAGTYSAVTGANSSSTCSACAAVRRRKAPRAPCRCASSTSIIAHPYLPPPLPRHPNSFRAGLVQYRGRAVLSVHGGHLPGGDLCECRRLLPQLHRGFLQQRGRGAVSAVWSWGIQS